MKLFPISRKVPPLNCIWKITAKFLQEFQCAFFFFPSLLSSFTHMQEHKIQFKQQSLPTDNITRTLLQIIWEKNLRKKISCFFLVFYSNSVPLNSLWIHSHWILAIRRTQPLSGAGEVYFLQQTDSGLKEGGQHKQGKPLAGTHCEQTTQQHISCPLLRQQQQNWLPINVCVKSRQVSKGKHLSWGKESTREVGGLKQTHMGIVHWIRC